MKHFLTKCLLTFLATGISLGVCSSNVTAQYNGVLVANAPVTSAYEPAVQVAASQGYYAADAVDLESRISNLESQLKKKQDKPDPQKGFTRVIDGRLYFDSYSIHQKGSDTGTSSLNTLQNYNGIRDLRIGVKGEGFGILDYKLDLCFIEGTGASGNRSGVNIKDAWLGIKNVPLLEYVRIGHYRIEEGVSVLTGGTNTTFLEFDGRDFATGRRIGISSRHLWAKDQIRFFAGFFYNENLAQNKRYLNRDNQGSITNLRLTFLSNVSRKEGKIDGKRFCLFGGNYSYFDANKTSPTTYANSSFSERFATVDQYVLATYSIPTNGYHKFGLEFASQNGPFAVQSEAYVNHYNAVKIGTTTKDRTIFGSYITVRYFLTGDYRKFSAENASWGAVDVKHNLNLQKRSDSNFAERLGAWEIAAKWGYAETSQLFGLATGDKVLFAGSVNDFTLGLNWYWSPQARWLFDYIHVVPSEIQATKSRDHSDTDIFAASFRYNF
ncbi:MAG: OprO/OprP family phosphate-selective porin [Planctomycetaceae bacterium]|jgi:phosphate-selective porin OprO/OprP|nr:OprO/OprP family phosphate-selective porin [Planctomycetaceae bacterium]